VLAARPSDGLMAALTSPYAGGMAARRLLLALVAFGVAAVLVVVGRNLGLYTDGAMAPLLVFLALAGGVALILVTAFRLNSYDLRHKATETMLRRSEEHQRELIGGAPDGIFMANLDARYVDVNDAGCRLFGLPREEIVGKSIKDFIRSEEWGRLDRDKEDLLAGGTVVSEWEARQPDGSYIPIEVSASILPDGRWQGFARDIRERKRAAAALDEARETDRRLRGELERVTRAAFSVAEAVAELPEPADISAVLHTVEQEAQVLTGAKYVAVGLGADPTAIDPWVVLGGADAAAGAPGTALRAADFQREPSFRGFPPYLPEGASLLGVPLRYRGRLVGNLYLAGKEGAGELSAEDRRMVEMLGARAAIAIETATLYAGQAMQRAWLRTIIDQLPEGVAVFDRAGKVVMNNRALLALAHEQEGARDPWGNPALFDVHTPDGEPIPSRELPVYRALERGEAVAGMELALRQPDGRMIPILSNAAPVRDDAGRITGATVVFQEISALKDLERLREEWASIIAHDLRQPVNAIMLTVDALERMHVGGPPGREQKAIDRIRSGVTRLSRMINDLLDASRIEARRLSVSPATVDLGALVEGVAEALRESAEGHPLSVVTVPGQLGRLDPDRIEQVLTNLITNAAKYADPGTAIRVEERADDETVEVTVTNQGPGIDPDERPQLFSRFGRTRAAREGGVSGLGLGLYISKGLVEAHGGRIDVDSVPGGETRFRFVLPRWPPEAHAADAAAPPG